MAEIVDCEMHLQSISVQLFLRQVQDCSVVHQNVYSSVFGDDVLREHSDRCLGTKVQWEVMDLTVLTFRSEFLHGGLGLGVVPSTYDDDTAFASEMLGRLLSYSSVASCHYGDLAGHVTRNSTTASTEVPLEKRKSYKQADTEEVRLVVLIRH